MKWGIKHQVLLLALVPTVTISILLAAYFTSTRLQDLKESFWERGEAIALKLASAGEYGVFSRNKALLQKLASSTLKEHDAQSVTFYMPSGEEIVGAGKSVFDFTAPKQTKILSKLTFQENNNAIAFIVPIRIYNEVDDLQPDPSQTKTLIGWLKFELDTKSIQAREFKILMNTGIILLLGLLISGLHAYQMGRNVTRPILEMAEAVEKIKKGELNTRIHVPGYQELKVLESGINTMAQALENAHNELQNKIYQATLSLRRSLETIEVQNIELEIARRTAENANRVKSEFLADMSHEIRTPLNGVIGFLHILKKTHLNPEQQEYINTIQKSATNLLAIINDILDFSKIEAGKLRIDRTPMDIRDCLDETLSLLAPHANEKNIALIPLIYSEIPSQVLGDPLRLKQIISNLVSNSIKFTDHGSVIVRIILEQDFFSHLIIRASVTDTGIGLSTEEQKTLFQPFNQLKIGTSRKLGGTGLGLVICKKLVEQMGGTIGVISEPQKGSTFWFTFQVEKLSLPLSRYEDVKTVPPTHSELDYLKGSFNVLAVDDNPDNLKLIKLLLEDLGIHVTALDNGQDAIEAVKHQSFHLILMDIRMPLMNGIECAQAIRQLESGYRRKPAPIVALTAHALVSERKALLAAGIDDYLTKPIEQPELLSILHKWLKESDREKTIDWELGKKLAGGRVELAKEFLNNLVATLPQEKAKINEEYQNKNWDSLRDIVHKLHGACCYCGVPYLKNCAQQLESSIATRTLDIIKPRVEALNLAIDTLLAELANIEKKV